MGTLCQTSINNYLYCMKQGQSEVTKEKYVLKVDLLEGELHEDYLPTISSKNVNLKIKSSSNIDQVKKFKSSQILNYELLKTNSLSDSKEKEAIAYYYFINRIKRVQTAVKSFIHKKKNKVTFEVESSCSINNLSQCLKSTDFIKSAPKLYTTMSTTCEMRKHSFGNEIKQVNKSHCPSVSCTNIDIKMTKPKKSRCSKYQITESAQNSNDLSRHLANSCKFFKLKKDTDRIKLIKTYLTKNGFEVAENSCFGVKVYSNKSKITGLFNSTGEASGIANYVCSSNVTYNGNS